MQWDEFRVFGSAFFWFLEEEKKKRLRWKKNQSTAYVGVLTDYGWRTTKRDVDQWSMPTIKILWKKFRIQENGLIDSYMWKEETLRRDRSRHGAIRYIYRGSAGTSNFSVFFPKLWWTSVWVFHKSKLSRFVGQCYRIVVARGCGALCISCSVRSIGPNWCADTSGQCNNDHVSMNPIAAFYPIFRFSAFGN